MNDSKVEAVEAQKKATEAKATRTCAGCGKRVTPKGIAAGECTYCHNFVPTPAEDEAEHAEHIKRLERRIADRIDGYDRDDLGLSEDR